MCANDCEWLMGKGHILIRWQSVPLLKCPHKINVRCVIVHDSVVVLADYASNDCVCENATFACAYAWQ